MRIAKLTEKAKNLPPIEKELKQIGWNGGKNGRNRKEQAN